MKSSVIAMKLAEILRCLHQDLWLPATSPGYKRSTEWVMVVASCNTLRNHEPKFSYTRTSKNPVLLYYSFNSTVSFVFVSQKSIQFFKRTNKFSWIYESNFVTKESLTYFGHSCSHHEDGENKNTYTTF